jgi:hypothetical protein
MAFGEDSFLKADHGDDMIWNPTSTVLAPVSSNSYLEPIFGGKHYIYVFGHNGEQKYLNTDQYAPNKTRNIPRYDKGKLIYELLGLTAKYGTPANRYKRDVFADAMWVNIPILADKQQLLATDVKIRLRVAKPYKSAYAVDSLSIDLANPAVNNNFPMYEFSTSDIRTVKNNVETA